MASSAGQPGFIEGSLTQTNGPFPTGASPNSKLPPLSPTSQPSSPIWEAKDEMHYVREALKTARDKRSESQLACVRDWLEQVKFQHVKMDDMRSVLPQLARQMEFSKPPGLEPLFKQGDPGDHLYLVLDGEVGMYIRTGAGPSLAKQPVNANVAVSRFARLARRGGSGGGGEQPIRGSEAQADSQDTTSPRDPATKNPDRVGSVDVLPLKWGKLVNTVKSGGSFGELALMSSTDTRSATAVPHRDTEFARIHRSVYQSLIKSRAEEAMRIKMLTLCGQPTLSTLEYREVQKLSYSFLPKSLPAKSTIVAQGMPCKNLYVIDKGEVRVLWRDGVGEPMYELATLYRGEMLGVLVEDELSEFTLQTTKATELYSISCIDFHQQANRWPEVLENTRAMMSAKRDGWRKRADAKRQTEPLKLQGPTGSDTPGGAAPPIALRTLARNGARTRRYSVGNLPSHKRLLDTIDRPQSLARLAKPAPAMPGGIASLTISPEALADADSARSAPPLRRPRAATNPDVLANALQPPTSWGAPGPLKLGQLRHELAVQPVGFS